MELWRKEVNVLGAGGYGTVRLAHPLASSYDQPIAVKSTDCSVTFAVEALQRESGVLRHLAGAPNVVQCFGEDTSLEDNRLVYNLLLEYASAGSLDVLIRRVGPMPELTVACYASMLLRGLAGIHSRGIVHCDIKSANILVFPDECGGIEELKIADFGLAKWDSELYFNRFRPTCDMCSGNRCPCADVYSIGCIIYEMMTGKGVWDWDRYWDLNDDIQNIPIQFPGNLSPNGVDFFKCCLNREVVSGFSAERLLEHPFIVENLRRVDQTITHNVRAQPWISTRNMFSIREEPAIGSYHQPQHSTTSIDLNRLPIC